MSLDVSIDAWIVDFTPPTIRSAYSGEEMESSDRGEKVAMSDILNSIQASEEVTYKHDPRFCINLI